MISKELAYIIGVFKGDGGITNRGYTLRLNAIDLDFVKNFRHCCLKEFGKCSKIKIKGDNQYRTELTSIKVVELLKQFDLNHILNYSDEMKGMFLRGMFDSEGGAYFITINHRFDRKIELYNTDYSLIRFCHILLESLGIKSKVRKRYRKERMMGNRVLKPTVCYGLYLRQSKDNLTRFKDIVGFTIKRKQDKLNQMIDTYYPYWNAWKRKVKTPQVKYN